MNECQHFGMQTETVYRTRLIAMTIFSVAYHRTTFARQMNTYLIRSSCLQVQLH